VGTRGRLAAADGLEPELSVAAGAWGTRRQPGQQIAAHFSGISLRAELLNIALLQDAEQTMSSLWSSFHACLRTPAEILVDCACQSIFSQSCIEQGTNICPGFDDGRFVPPDGCSPLTRIASAVTLQTTRA